MRPNDENAPIFSAIMPREREFNSELSLGEDGAMLLMAINCTNLTGRILISLYVFPDTLPYLIGNPIEDRMKKALALWRIAGFPYPDFNMVGVQADVWVPKLEDLCGRTCTCEHSKVIGIEFKSQKK